MDYWFVRMRQGSDGPDYARELWQSGRIGILFGHWTMDEVLDGSGLAVNRAHLHSAAVQSRFPEEAVRRKDVEKLRRWTNEAETFLLELQPDDRVLVAFDQHIHVGTVGQRYLADPIPREHNGYIEFFKCRDVQNRKSFLVADLPSVFRLVPHTGRQTIQRMSAYRHLAEILDQAATTEQVRTLMRQMPDAQFLDLLSDKGWEALCTEYLRVTIGFRPLLLVSGSTLRAVDIVGVDQAGRRVVGQCKNSGSGRATQEVRGWMEDCASSREDVSYYYFARGGIRGAWDGNGCVVVDGEEILRWLQTEPDYFRALKEL